MNTYLLKMAFSVIASCWRNNRITRIPIVARSSAIERANDWKTATSNRARRCMVIGAVALISQVSFSAQHIASAALIGLDAVHGFDADDFLATGSDHDTLRATITGMGHTIVPLSSFGAGDLSGLDAAFFVTPYNQNGADYSASEMAAIQAFANQRAVFLSDSDLWADSDTPTDRPISFGDNQALLENVINYIISGQAGVFLGDDGSGFNVANMNALVAPFGISYASSPTDGSGRTVSGFNSHAVTVGLNQIGVDFQLPMTVNSPSLDLTIGTGQDNVLAVFEVIPEPTSLTLAAIGLLGVCCLRRKRR